MCIPELHHKILDELVFIQLSLIQMLKDFAEVYKLVTIIVNPVESDKTNLVVIQTLEIFILLFIWAAKI